MPAASVESDGRWVLAGIKANPDKLDMTTVRPANQPDAGTTYQYSATGRVVAVNARYMEKKFIGPPDGYGPPQHMGTWDFTFSFDNPQRTIYPGQNLVLNLKGSAIGSTRIKALNGPQQDIRSARCLYKLTYVKDGISGNSTYADDNPYGLTMTEGQQPRSESYRFLIRKDLEDSTDEFRIRAMLAGPFNMAVEWTYKYLTGPKSDLEADDWIDLLPDFLKPEGSDKRTTEVRGKITVPRGQVDHYLHPFRMWKYSLKGEIPIYTGDRVRTGPNSSCKVMFTNRAGKQDTILVGSNTLLEIPDIPEREIKLSWPATIYIGILMVKHRAMRERPTFSMFGPPSFIVRTPTVVAGVGENPIQWFRGGGVKNDRSEKNPPIIAASLLLNPGDYGLRFALAAEDWTGVSEYIIQVDSDKTTRVFVNEGTVYALNLVSKKTTELLAGQRITAQTNGAEEQVEMAPGQWDSLIIANNLEGADKTAPSIPSHNAYVRAFELFEGGPKHTGEREYKRRFSKAAARRIYWELTLDYPLSERDSDIDIKAVWKGQDIKFPEQFVKFPLKANMTRAGFAISMGWNSPGYWKPGIYSVDLFVNGQAVAGDLFEIYEGGPGTPEAQQAEESSGIPVLNARVSGLRFFESPIKAAAYEQRKYATRFSKSATRYIFWEMTLKYPAPGRITEFDIDTIWYRQDGNVLGNQKMKTRVEPKWTSTIHANSWGAASFGNWPPGNYRVEIYIKGQEIARGYFQIDAD
ncbi:MAG: FecR family protein [Planctomycetota bacterium]